MFVRRGLAIAPRDFRVRMHGVPVAAQRADANVLVVEFLFPRARLRRVVENILERTVGAGASDLYSFQAQFLQFVE